MIWIAQYWWDLSGDAVQACVHGVTDRMRRPMEGWVRRPETGSTSGGILSGSKNLN